jgi:hypothetical protein
MKVSNLVAATAISAICFLLPLGAQEPQIAGHQNVTDSPLFHNPFAGRRGVTVTPSAKTPVVKAEPSACAIPLLNVAPKDAAHYTTPTVSPRKDVDPGIHVPSIPVCAAGTPEK